VIIGEKLEKIVVFGKKRKEVWNKGGWKIGNGGKI